MYDSFNYRIVRNVEKDLLQMYEVWYDAKGNVSGWRELQGPLGFDMENLKADFEDMRAAFDRPVLSLHETLTISTEDAEAEVKHGDQLELDLNA